jgi:uncharacterized protein (DUF362 family)
MWGYLHKGAKDFEEGNRTGKAEKERTKFDVIIEVDSLEDFMHLSGREARLSGTFDHPHLGYGLSIREGRFALFQVDPRTGKIHMEYRFAMTGDDGSDYTFFGFKMIHDDPGLDIIKDMTTLFSRIYQGPVEQGNIWGSGILRFHIKDLPSMIFSMEATGTTGLGQSLKTKARFLSFVYGNLRKVYLNKISLFYRTGYENLVLRGTVSSPSGEKAQFFLVSGIHQKDFPWGDGGGFWDILLYLRSEREVRRYALSRWRLEDLNLNVRQGQYRYQGQVFKILEGNHISVSEMTSEDLPPHLERSSLQMDISFKADPLPVQNLPFSFSPFSKEEAGEKLSELRSKYPHLATLGVEIIPHRIKIQEGRLQIDGEYWEIQPELARGEAEISTWMNLRWPTLYYRYFCALSDDEDKIRLHIRSNVLRPNRQNPLKDRVEKSLGGMANLIAWLDLETEDGISRKLSREEGDAFPEKGEILLEVRNNHYPTSVLLRRIVGLSYPDGKIALGLHEDMDPLNLGALNSTEEIKVASIRNPDKFLALDKLLEMTDFFNKVEEVCERSGKSIEEFSIVIKVNLMFAYSRNDPTTFTDPELVEHLVGALKEKGYTNVAVADARSTYGIFFNNREVKTVATYFGYKFEEKGYPFLDLSEELVEHTFGSNLGRHWVSAPWKDADFRISFAKNKTHSYAFYTLCLKNIYGALPLEDKFKEYHVERDIVHTTMEYLEAFPVHFGIIDAYISADGPFGIFADRTPNRTQTLIGGENLVCVDWIGAAKMGLDPMVSPYMEEAVRRFGKPEIILCGDAEIYPNWENVTPILSEIAFDVIDRNYAFGNLFYSVFSTMDPHFSYKDDDKMRRIIRVLDGPIRSIFFERMKHGELERKITRKLYKLLTLDR